MEKIYRMVQERATKGTVVYSDIDGNLKTVYIPKTEFGAENPPEFITLTLNTADINPNGSRR